ncbi:transcriptional regulator, Crp/Fnr family [Sulfuricurvum kujiense DSM 16994]|uniref:Transcriptional regulator, Crp/Fnr family n=1 Tax=Sulfuricurvum kujiense (strain ATCC BAA-921 / DSM 16994 / JCM 11577 / YK-1) TaxID=709032 RepID=E4TYP2_SULKY|nr:transcriptional regulator, Crp/Fnr family [Sulfuricurvum kujiense DSM 16994]
MRKSTVLNQLPQNNSLSLERIGIFSHLTPLQCNQIEQIGIIRHYNKGEIIFYEGNQSDYFHFLIEGEVSIFKSTASTETMLIHRFRAPSLVAEVATLKQVPYPASCEAIDSSIILKIARDPFLKLLQNDPSLSIALISSLTQKISALELSLQRHSAPNAMAKVARLIRDDIGIFQRLKGIEIAHLLGITPETLSRMIKKLKSEGIIEFSKKNGLNLLSSDKLNRCCG